MSEETKDPAANLPAIPDAIPATLVPNVHSKAELAFDINSLATRQVVRAVARLKGLLHDCQTRRAAAQARLKTLQEERDAAVEDLTDAAFNQKVEVARTALENLYDRVRIDPPKNVLASDRKVHITVAVTLYSGEKVVGTLTPSCSIDASEAVTAKLDAIASVEKEINALEKAASNIRVQMAQKDDWKENAIAALTDEVFGRVEGGRAAMDRMDAQTDEALDTLITRLGLPQA